MAKKTIAEPAAPVKAKKPKATSATAGINSRLATSKTPLPFKANGVEKRTITYADKRIDEMIEYRRSLGVENKWREADEEYIPHELDFGTTRKRFETDQDTGLRSRMVPVGDQTQQWRQASSAPTLLVKIQTALSLIIDQMPEADLVPLLKKFEKTTDLAYSLWKRNWSITHARQKLILIVFDLIKYGWAAQRTFPRIVKYPKRILTSKDPENPENDLYTESDLTWFNDIDREPLNVFRTWVDELSKPYDQFSTNEAYYELDYSYDVAQVEFGQYENWKYVPRNSYMQRDEQERRGNRQTQNKEKRKRTDVVTVGFFQSRTKDLLCIYVPSAKIPLYISPLPNDDGYIDITHTMWLLRHSSTPYGISLWEVIRQNKGLYDKMKNMTMDQLVLSIMKFGFFSGTNTNLGDGMVSIIPGQARQLTSSTGKPEVDWMEIPGPGEDSWRGIQAISDMMDNESGINALMEGVDDNKGTLGEMNRAQEANLKRLKVPVDNIAWLLENDAMLTLSWMSQVYSVPTVMEFSSIQELQDFEKENEMTHNQLFGQVDPSTGGAKGPFEAHYLPQLALHLEDSEGNLKRSKDSKFFQIGTKDGQIDPKLLKWRGIFKVIPRSIIDSSQELIKQSKSEMANMLIPLLSQDPAIAARPAYQLVKINEEDPTDWLPDSFTQYLKDGTLPPPPAAAPDKPNITINYKDVADPTAQKALLAIAGVQPAQPAPAPGGPAGAQGVSSIFTPQSQNTLKDKTGNTPAEAPLVVPKNEVS